MFVHGYIAAIEHKTKQSAEQVRINEDFAFAERKVRRRRCQILAGLADNVRAQSAQPLCGNPSTFWPP